MGSAAPFNQPRGALNSKRRQLLARPINLHVQLQRVDAEPSAQLVAIHPPAHGRRGAFVRDPGAGQGHEQIMKIPFGQTLWLTSYEYGDVDLFFVRGDRQTQANRFDLLSICVTFHRFGFDERQFGELFCRRMPRRYDGHRD